MSHIIVTEQTHIPNSDRNTERNVPVVRRRTLARRSQRKTGITASKCYPKLEEPSPFTKHMIFEHRHFKTVTNPQKSQKKTQNSHIRNMHRPRSEHIHTYNSIAICKSTNLQKTLSTYDNITRREPHNMQQILEKETMKGTNIQN